MRQRTSFVRLVQPRRAFDEFPLFSIFKAIVHFHLCQVWLLLEKTPTGCFGNDTMCISPTSTVKIGFCFLWRFGFTACAGCRPDGVERLTGLLTGYIVYSFLFFVITESGIRVATNMVQD
jgi:hypothetical protein